MMSVSRLPFMLGSALALVLVSQARAQEPPKSGVIALDEITVTSLKRKADPQNVPIAITVIDGAAIPNTSSDPAREMVSTAPNVMFNSVNVAGQDFLNIRGIGPLALPINALDNTVGVSTNGVPTTMFGYPPTLLDVQQIEVLRGPQGTLFGRNALGGAINVVTKPADGTREFRTTVEAGKKGHLLGEAVAGGWLVPEVLAGRAALRFSRVDGDIPNTIAGGKEGAARLSVGRGSLRFTPSGDLTIDLRASYDQDRRTGQFSLLKEHPRFPVSGGDIVPWITLRRADASLTVEKRFDAFTMTSVTSFQDITSKHSYDYFDSYVFGALTGLPPRTFADPLNDKIRTLEHDRIFNQELRLNSAEGSWLSWVGGISYFRSDYDQQRTARTSSVYANGDYDTAILSQTGAIFGDATVPLSERLKLSGGLRLARDWQSLDSRYRPLGAPGILTDRNSISDTYLTGRAALSYEWQPGLITYGSVARGYTSGGFDKVTLNSALGLPNRAFSPSTGWTYELGAKSDFLDGRARLNASLFFNDVEKGQIIDFLVSGSTVSYVFANQDYRSRGFELEGSLRLTDQLSLNGSFGLTRSELVNVPVTQTRYRNGNAVPNAPSVTASFGVDYRLPASLIGLPGEFLARASYQYVGQREADLANNFKLDAYHIVNGRIGWSGRDTQVYAFANNLLDERPQLYGAAYSPAVHSMAVGRGRVIGLGLSRNW
ncbi:TonB-dependent receptor [Bosea sp. TWI1241]|uniref:TonB-dependent receptor n=1 Tax=Bosea sp. TWI1241 TaxID=3148904 RepID=UPI00320A07EA